MTHSLILTLACPDRPAIVAAVSACLVEAGANITESHQFGDKTSGRFFMRIAFDTPANCDDIKTAFAPVAQDYDMRWDVYDAKARPRVLIMLSRFDHCLVDLIYRTRIGSLPMDIAAIISNHEQGERHARNADIPFFLWDGDKAEVEKNLNELIARENIELIVLARYMQVLSREFVAEKSNRIINIHHSFLPSFKGAEPYSRAFERGVKMIGATAHFVNEELDEGPIVSQSVADIRHDMSVTDIIDVGRDVERRALADAVKLYLNRRVLLNGKKTIVFK